MIARQNALRLPPRLCLLFFLSWAGCSSPESDPLASSGSNEPETVGPKSAAPEVIVQEIRQTSRAIGPEEVVSDGYVSSDACQECHVETHRSWHASYHRTMTQPVDSETAPAAINGQVVEVQGKTYAFEKQGDHYSVTFPDPLLGGQVHRRRLVLMTGSHHMNVFWYESGVHGTPAQLDIVFLKQEQRWVPRDSSFLQPNHHSNVIELGTWNRTCSRCHATHPKEGYRNATQDWETKVVEHGIACEACHGQGNDHIQQHSTRAAVLLAEGQNANTQDITEADSAADQIVNPSQLSKHASADLCGQCHSVFIPDYDVLSEADYARDGNPFRPGQLLSDTGFSKVVRATEEYRNSEAFVRWSKMEDLGSTFWSDGTIRIAGREYNGLIESPCFQDGEMTCLSCHTMHPSGDQDLTDWRDDQLKPGMRGDEACLQCHDDYRDQIAEHTHHPIESSGSRCMNCHMPHTTYGLLKTIRSHRITSPSIRDSQTSDRPDACSLCHLDQSFAWVSSHLRNWYGQTGAGSSGSDAVATSVSHLLRGDAAQRAVQVAAMGWQPAQEASGTKWIEPFLLLALNDPYDAVRLLSARSMKTLPERFSLPIDPLDSASKRMTAFNESIQIMEKELNASSRPEVLIDEQGRIDFVRVRALLDQRNHRPIVLRE
ncbi:cytochrome c3 family protein [Neorhodopirellula pilleata]|uniref:Doubled CXXCH motif n=1 Tax=Neorhodopirellula pilleata TaxID=2714738 RepID=A0A5C6AV46_9BACT|nr:cytochrome c3 family protein [Neorhodopirellula pilleata]TWU03311.1 Doubled CXXCH motif [Neorhodopirellula pilleata]